jgi:hypothetical protein
MEYHPRPRAGTDVRGRSPVFQEIEALRNTPQETGQTPARSAATARYEEATTTAVSDANVRFTMSELDQLLAAE